MPTKNKTQNKKTAKVKIAIVASLYRKEIVDNLIASCYGSLDANGLAKSDVDIFRVPGALEIPLMAKKLAKAKKYDAIIVFGVVLKGDTYHFEQVADECVRGCMDVSYDFEIPVVFQVLSVYKLADAMKRSKGTVDNRGIEGAETALSMIALYKNI